jgi:pimeloyl-ACP methyl ester carboxylesterase
MRPVLLALAATLLLAAPAGAQERTVTVPSPGPGPSAYDRVTVTKIGPSRARTVLVLVPGYYGGAGDFLLVGRDIVRRVGGLQVWAYDRRSQALEDTKVFDEARAGRRSVRSAFDFYLGWLEREVSPHFEPQDVSELQFAKRWGLSMALNDLRRVVLSARRQGKRVILGGHSLGASMTTLYAAWDFGGRPGYCDIEGLVLIDGGTLGSFTAPTLAGTRRELRELQEAPSPFVDLLGIGAPWAAGVFAQFGAVAALREPTAPSIGQPFSLLPAEFKPPVPATNRALLGYAFDKETSPEALSLIRVNAGRLASSGDPRDWDDGEVTPIRRLAETFAARPNATEWYFPDRLRIEVDAAQELRRNAQTRLLGLRPWHLRAVDRPLYAIETDLTNGRVLRGARRFVARSKSPRSLARLVDAAATDSHLDPLTAAPSTSRFLQTVVPWLKKVRDR